MPQGKPALKKSVPVDDKRAMPLSLCPAFLPDGTVSPNTDTMHTISLINNRQGLGKSVAALNLAHALALRGRRVMLVDMDQKADLVRLSGLFRPPNSGIAQVLLEGKALDEVAVSTRELISLVPTGEGLEQVDALNGGKGEGLRLFESLQAEPPDADYLIIDGPSSAGLLFANAVLAADLLLVPMSAADPEEKALLNLNTLLQRFDTMRGRPAIIRAFLNRTVGRGLAAKPVHQAVAKILGDLLLEVVLPEADVVAESAAMGRTLFEYRPQSGVAKAYGVMAAELEVLLGGGDEAGIRGVAS